MAAADYRMSYPILTGDIVKQGHADACAEFGHATHTIDGVDQDVCPRCGAVKPFGPKVGDAVEWIATADEWRQGTITRIYSEAIGGNLRTGIQFREWAIIDGRLHVRLDRLAVVR